MSDTGIAIRKIRKANVLSSSFPIRIVDKQDNATTYEQHRRLEQPRLAQPMKRRRPQEFAATPYGVRLRYGP